VGIVLTSKRFGILRCLARPDALRSVFALILLVVFATATSLAQSHVHFKAAERGNLAASLDDGAFVAVSAQKQLPAGTPDKYDTRCPMCQAQIASGTYVATQSFTLDLPASARTIFSSEEQTTAGGLPVAPWHSRAPPAV